MNEEFERQLAKLREAGLPADVIAGELANEVAEQMVAKIWDDIGEDPPALESKMEELRVVHHNLLEDARIPDWEDEQEYGEQRRRGQELASVVGRVIAGLVQRMKRT